MRRLLLPVLLILILLGGCTTLRETGPTQAARQQLLLSTAADQASARIDPNLPTGSRLYLDTRYFGSDAEYQDAYAIAAIKTALLRRGFRLAESSDEADTIVLVSSGALSINRTEKLFGLPGGNIPIPLAGPLSTPEIAFWKETKRTGVAKFLLTFYDAETGALQQTSDPVYGFSHYDRGNILFYGYKRSNLLSPEAEKRSK